MALATSGKQSEILLNVGTNELEIIEFVVGGQHFGINVAKVKQVVQWNPDMLTRVHDAQESIMGMVYHRGKPVTLIDLRKALRITAEPAEETRKLVLVTQFNDVITAFQIDQVNRIHRLSWKQLEPFKEFMPGITSYITGSVQIQDRLIMVLDLEHLMSILTPHLGIQASVANISKVGANKKRADVTIMFAEDSSMIRRMTSDQLRLAGFTNVLVFENGLRAHEKLLDFDKQSKATGKPITDFVNLLLTDIEMPQMDGLTLCKEVKQVMGHGDLPVVIYSSLINDQMAIKCRSVGSNAHICKPRIDEIVGIIDQHCHLTAAA